MSDYSQVLARFDPQASLLGWRALHGGISAQTIALEVCDGSGKPRTLVVRRVGAREFASDPLTAAEQFALLAALHATGLPVPEPLFLDESRELLPEPYLLLAHLPGKPDTAPADRTLFARTLARKLAEIHRRAATAIASCSFLPTALARFGLPLARPPFTCDPDYPQHEIRAVLARAWPLARHNPNCVLHGDFWAGNLLWHDGVLSGVIDWADALIGDPLADLAVARLDLSWMLDDAAMVAFTDAYAAETACDLRQLPYWDLLATLRPGSRLGAWTSVWEGYGRNDITVPRVYAGRAAFARRALAALERAASSRTT